MTDQLKHSYQIQIRDMTCHHCVTRVEKTALSVEQVESIDINLDKGEAIITGGSPVQVIQAISRSGYPCEILSDKNLSPDEESTAKDKTANISITNINDKTNPTDINNHYTISIDDMTCSSCVANVEQAICSVSGVIEASVNLLEKSAWVAGGDPQQVVNAIIDQGYKASLQEQQAPGNGYQLITNSSDEHQILKILSNNSEIQNIKITTSDDDDKQLVTLTSTLHPAQLLILLKQANIQTSINEQSEDPYAAQARQSKIEIKQSRVRAFFAIAIASLLMFSEHSGLLPTLDNHTQFYGISSQLFWFIIALVCLFTMWFSGRNYYITAIKQARHYSANMDTLVALGTSSAWLSSMLIIIDPDFIPGGGHLYLDAGVMILGFLQFGHALEIQAKRTTSESIASIIKLAPKTATLIYNNIEVQLPVSLVKPGDIIKVKPGERLPTDGIITHGSSTVDESMLTGEPLAVNKSTGDKVTGATINKSGSFSFKVTRTGDDTTLAHIIKMVKQAQMTKPAIGRLVDKIAAVFVPLVISISIITFFLWFFIGPQPQLAYALTTGIAVLVIACPCALGLATPIAIMMGTSKAAQFNILIKNSDALQTASQLTHLVVDKTGTLTQGKPAVTEIIINDTVDSTIKTDQDSLLQLAASLEKHSEHPLAEAMIKAADERNISTFDVKHFLAVEGRGVQAVLAEKENTDKIILLGNLQFMQENNIAVSDKMKKQAVQLSESAATPVWIAGNGVLLGLIGLKDPLREDTLKAVHIIKKQNITLVICSGDTDISCFVFSCRFFIRG